MKRRVVLRLLACFLDAGLGSKRGQYQCGQLRMASTYELIDLEPPQTSYLIYTNTEDVTPPPAAAKPESEPAEGEETSADASTTSEAGVGGEGTPAKPDSAPSGEGAADVAAEEEKKRKGPLRNQFNFSERASQTVNDPYRVSGRPRNGMISYVRLDTLPISGI